MTRKLLAAVMAMSCAAIWMMPSSAGAKGAGIGCGATITVDTTLTNDLWDCHGIGLVIGADHVKLDLNGHTVDGDGVGDFEGIQPKGHSGISVEHGAISDFVEGIAVLGGSDITVRRLVLTGHRHVGIFVDGTSDALIDDNRSTDIAFAGIFVTRSHDVRINTNRVRRSGSGIGVRASHGVDIARNATSENGCGGVELSDGAHDNTVVGNTLTGNGCDGVTVANGSNHNVV